MELGYYVIILQKKLSQRFYLLTQMSSIPRHLSPPFPRCPLEA